VKRLLIIPLLITALFVAIWPIYQARAVTHIVPQITYTCVKWGMRWNADGTRTVTVACNDAQGNEKYYIPFKLDANNVYDRFGTQVLVQSGSFKTALSTIESQIDGALSGLEAAGSLSPP